MRRTFAVAPVIGALVLVTSAPATARGETITLAEAIRLAETQSPELLIARAERAIAEGELRSARTITHNPELGEV